MRGRSIAVLSLPENNAQRILLLIVALSRLSEDVTWCANGVPVDDFILQILTSRKIRVRRERIAKLSGTGKQLEQIVFTEGVVMAAAGGAAAGIGVDVELLQETFVT